MNRREFLTEAARWSVGGGLAVSTGWSFVSENGFKEVTPEVKSILDEQSASLNNRINAVALHQYQKQLYRWNVPNISRALCYLAYLDGGFDEVDRVVQYIKERQLIVDTEAGLSSSGMLAYHSPSYNIDKPLFVTIDSGEVGDYENPQTYTHADTTIFHELYHCIQEANNPQNYWGITIARIATVFGAGIASGIAVGRGTSRTIDQKYRPGRSDIQRERMAVAASVGLLAGVVATPVGAILTRFVSGIFEPLETAAYIKTGGSNPVPQFVIDGTLTRHPLMKTLSGKFLDKFEFKTW